MPACFSMISCIAWDHAFEVSQEKRLLLVGRAGVSVMVATVFSNMKSYCCKRSILLSTWNECRGNTYCLRLGMLGEYKRTKSQRFVFSFSMEIV